MKKKMLVALVLMLAALFTATAFAEVMYVKTSSGKGVHVRAEPSSDAEQWARAPYGQAVNVISTSNGWAWCDIPGFSNPGYIALKNLSRKNPGPAPEKKTPKPTPKKTPSPKTTPVPSGISYKGFYAVEHYDVYVNHQTSTYLNLRWAPSESEAIIRRCYNGTVLTVYAESNGWYQVYDEETGLCGFMRPKYLEPVYE